MTLLRAETRRLDLSSEHELSLFLGKTPLSFFTVRFSPFLFPRPAMPDPRSPFRRLAKRVERVAPPPEAAEQTLLLSRFQRIALAPLIAPAQLALYVDAASVIVRPGPVEALLDEFDEKHVVLIPRVFFSSSALVAPPAPELVAPRFLAAEAGALQTREAYQGATPTELYTRDKRALFSAWAFLFERNSEQKRLTCVLERCGDGARVLTALGDAATSDQLRDILARADVVSLVSAAFGDGWAPGATVEVRPSAPRLYKAFARLAGVGSAHAGAPEHDALFRDTVLARGLPVVCVAPADLACAVFFGRSDVLQRSVVDVPSTAPPPAPEPRRTAAFSQPSQGEYSRLPEPDQMSPAIFESTPETRRADVAPSPKRSPSEPSSSPTHKAFVKQTVRKPSRVFSFDLSPRE